jgi:hypothetical protein
LGTNQRKAGQEVIEEYTRVLYLLKDPSLHEVEDARKRRAGLNQKVDLLLPSLILSSHIWEKSSSVARSAAMSFWRFRKL